MRRHSLTSSLATALTLVVSLIVATGAQAGVLSYQGGNYGVRLVPGTPLSALPASATPVSSSVPCLTPSPARAGVLPNTGLCYHGGPVVHKNQTFAVVWNLDGHTNYAAPYMEQFLRNVANGSGSTSSPYAISSQYKDASGAAANASLYGGAYTDTTSETNPGTNCTPTGPHNYSQGTNSFVTIQNDVCVTDAQIQDELKQEISQKQLWRTQPGYTPLIVFLTPPGVETCLDSAGRLCSANSEPSQVSAQFCSYHSQVNVNTPQGLQAFNYVVQPWSAGTESPGTGCDEPDAPGPPTSGAVDPHTLATDMGGRLVSPLSQAMLAAIVNPQFNGWFANNGAEISDNGCVGLALGLDQVSVAGNSYYLQREFNNAGMMVDNPFALPCAPSVGLEPDFVVPSPINNGDLVEFDGANSPSTLIVPDNQYVWNFGDGTTAVGPSVVHSYDHGGTYTAKLTVTDRGGYVASSSQTVVVLGPPAPVGSPPVSFAPTAQPTSAAAAAASPALAVRLQLKPQGLQTVLRSGLAIKVTSNQRANGIVTLSIPRKAAKRARISAGSGATVVIGRGTISGIKSGVNNLHLHLSQATADKLKRLGHVTLTIRLALVAAGGHRIAIVTAGRY